MGSTVTDICNEYTKKQVIAKYVNCRIDQLLKIAKPNKKIGVDLLINFCRRLDENIDDTAISPCSPSLVFKKKYATNFVLVLETLPFTGLFNWV